MKNILSNSGYFLKEVKTMVRLNLLSNILSIFSTGLIFFVLAMVISGWRISSQVVEAIQQEAEISVYFNESIGSSGADRLSQEIKGLKGVRDARVVGKDEAYSRMAKILGKDSKVLEVFDENPFSSFIEVKINLEQFSSVIEKLNHITGIEGIRDNREVLDRIRNIAAVLKLLGYLIVAAVGISTLVIISHIIRLGVYNNRDQINTLRLLGAPEIFIAFPFLLEGLLLTLAGGLIAAALASLALKQVYALVAGPLPFIPLPPRETLVTGMFFIVVSLSAVLGIVGSLFGLSSGRRH